MPRKYIIPILMLIILLCNPELTTLGVKNGLILWFNSIIPSILPAMILTNIISNGINTKFRYKKAYATLIGLFCGYPMGATTLSTMQLPKMPLLLAACNTSGMAFVINYIYFGNLRDLTGISEFLIATYAPVIVLLLISYIQYSIMHKQNISKGNKENSNQGDSGQVIIEISFSDILDEAISKSSVLIIKLGGYIILFSILSVYIHKLPIENELVKGILIGFAEITNGINYIKNSHLPEFVKLITIVCINAFGGLSCLMQTNSVLKIQVNDYKYSIVTYFFHKLILTFITFVICIVVFGAT